MRRFVRRFMSRGPEGGGESKRAESDMTDGCDYCWPSDADAAWDARRKLQRGPELADEAHFHVMVLICPRCGQRFVSVFTETIDWAKGNDPQYWSVIPVLEAEARGLEGLDEWTLQSKLDRLAPARRALRRDLPQSGAGRTYWAQGMVAGPHD